MGDPEDFPNVSERRKAKLAAGYRERPIEFVCLCGDCGCPGHAAEWLTACCDEDKIFGVFQICKECAVLFHTYPDFQAAIEITAMELLWLYFKTGNGGTVH